MTDPSDPTQAKSAPLLSVDHIHAMRGQRTILNDISFELYPGETVVLAGRSGVGKSTLLRIVAGLLTPSSGEVRWTTADRLVGSGEPVFAGSRVGFVRQQPDAQLIASTVEEEIAFGLGMAGLDSDQVKEAVVGALERWGLLDVRPESPGNLSGGMQQRLAIAAAWALKPSLWLLDEPTSHLDRAGRDALHGVIHQIGDQTTVLMVAADPEEYQLGDRLFVLDQGRLTAAGLTGDVLAGKLFRSGVLSLPRSHVVSAALSSDDNSEVASPAMLLPESRAARSTSVPSAGHDSPARLSARKLVIRRRDLLSPEREVLHGIDLELRQGECVALVGASGSGKTTLLQALAGLDKPAAGDVTAYSESVSQGVQAVGLAFQFPERSFFAETVQDELTFGPRNLGLVGDEPLDRATAALERVGLKADEFRPRDPFSLSGGEARRVALAAVLALQPSVLLLDEPTAGLDSADRKRLAELLHDEVERGTAILVSGHDHDWLADLCPRWVMLEAGRVVHDGPALELWTGPRPWHVDPPETVRQWLAAGHDLSQLSGASLADVLGVLRKTR